ncbi:nucleotidyltransferase domain-containing protein [Amycolatopsis sp. lyj-23]|uniref:nucleotidyltransferase domain-containing protein n=1 Tax=Amycolatopsis sp. lyj-23 TaxID=2789283 RepID=UPI00397BD41A
MPLVQSIYVFGSYARGALEPADVDIAVDFSRDRRWTSHFVHCMSYGKNPYVVFNKALRGNSRSVSIIFEPQSYEDIPMTLLWQRGESIDTALERLHAIPADPAAGRAPRHGMLPCFDGLDEWIPRPVREEVAGLVEDEVVTVEQLTLVDKAVVDPTISELIESRWIETSPLRRAARAAVAHLEERGADLHSLFLHGEDTGAELTPFSIGFQLTHLRSMLRIFAEYGGQEWIEVVHPTRRSPLHALRIVLKDRRKLEAKKMPSLSYFAPW